jgi:hypothetical protein
VQRWRTPAALAALLLLTAGFYWKLTLSRDWTCWEAPDLANLVRPWFDMEAREVHAGRIPLWSPYEWGGHTLAGQVQPAVFNPLNWPLLAMPLDDGHLPIRTLHWYWVLIHWLGAAFCFALCRDLGADRVSAILGASIFALAGFVGHTDWPQILMSAIWLPLVLLFFARVARGCRPWASAPLAGAALGMAFLGGHHVVPTFTSLVLGALWIVYLALDWRRLARWGHAALFGVTCLLVAAVQILPAIEYAKLSLRWAGAAEPLRWGEPVPFSVHAQYSLGWRSVFGIVWPGISLHANPHVGFAAVALAAFALWHFRHDARVRWFGGIALAGLLVALGKDFPGYWMLWRFVPMVEKAREPAMAIVIAQAGIAVLAALGAARFRRPWIPAAALTLFLAEAVSDAPRLTRFDRRDSYAAMIERQSDIAAFLKAQPGWFRVEFDEEAVPYNFGDLHAIEQFGGLGSSLPLRTFRLLGREETPRLFGVRYRVVRKPSNPAQVAVFTSRSGLTVYHDPRVADPLWTWRDMPCTGTDRLRMVSRNPRRVVVEADLACPALVVVGDAFYPGWRATVDGARRPVQELDAVRAVQTGAGHHMIEFFYRPPAVMYGAALTLLGLIVAGVCAWRGK